MMVPEPSYGRFGAVQADMGIACGSCIAIRVGAVVVPVRPSSPNDQNISVLELDTLKLSYCLDLCNGDRGSLCCCVLDVILYSPSVVVDQHTAANDASSFGPV